MSSNNNPLILSGNNLTDSIKNIITDENVLMQLVNENYNSLTQIKNFDPNTISGINNGLNNILESVPLKTGCCMRNQNDNTEKNVKVRVKLQNGALGELKNFGFEWKNVNIPAGKCPTNLYKGSPDCDAFFNVYCGNVNTVFTEQFGKQVDDSTNKYPIYAPECACYAPIAVGQESFPPGIPSACYKQDCAVTGSASYPDPTSRTQPCDATICSSIINTAGLTAGGNVNINPTIVQECGATSTTSQTGTSSENTSNNNNNTTNNTTNNTNTNNTTIEQKTSSKSSLSTIGKISIGVILSICCSLSLILIYFIFLKKKIHKRHFF